MTKFYAKKYSKRSHLKQLHSWTCTYFIDKFNRNSAFFRNGGQQRKITATHQISHNLLKCSAEQLHLAYFIHDNYRQLTCTTLQSHHHNALQQQQTEKHVIR